MLKLLIDTCVWLDTAKDHRQQVTLRYLEELIDAGEVSLILPRQVLEEFANNRDRIIRENQQSLSSVFRRVKDTVNQFGDEAHRAATLSQLNDVDHRIATLSEAVVGSIEHIERLFGRTEVVELSDPMKVRAAERAITRRAPFHRGKNSMGDAILIETFADAVAARAANDTLVFVTHNTRDFSVEAGDLRQPHPHLDNLFADGAVTYSTGLAQILNELQPDLLEEVRFELEWDGGTPRRLSELIEAERELFYKVWYNRHLGLRYAVEDGKVKIVSKREWGKTKDNSRFITRDIWKGARAAAKRVEEEYAGNLGPWSDFEWGMINGKLSAIRWAMGDEWDMLDT
ncbi:PIN domain-containing protein [Phenylobacterium sp.]|uniref:PIN domain-containing protein n=1 Tax=Phenylobacterium sp. TaxID=1871053 RepID=UPI0027308382|nr:PIN domain-containing protein [Phenylobacterium sp.]MDP2214092.1 PIN domain-containing protein [Phenylobacterium sp.]